VLGLGVTNSGHMRTEGQSRVKRDSHSCNFITQSDYRTSNVDATDSRKVKVLPSTKQYSIRFSWDKTETIVRKPGM
jgi:hypothetical protein